MGLKTGYILTYNTIQSCIWAYALFLLVRELFITGTHEGVHSAVTPVLRVGQVFALMEIVHAATGLVRSGVFTAFVQWFARTHCLVAVVDSVPEVQGELWVTIMYAAWGITEVVRYPWYAFSTISACPGWLTWMRYTVFIPMYPFGVVAEMILLYLALPFAKAREMYNLDMPNALNFAFDWHIFLVGGLMYYPFAWLQLYTHMFAQRKKKLSPSKKID